MSPRDVNPQEPFVHTVTKILVLFAAILCVLLAALTMSYSANADKVLADYNTLKNRLTTTEAQNAAQISGAQTQLTAANQRSADLANQIAGLEAQIKQLQGERSQLMVDKQRAEAGRDGIQNRIDELVATNKTQSALIDNYSKEVTGLRTGELAWKRREIELNDRVNDLSSQNEVLEGSVRALQEQLAEARRQIEQGGTAAAASAGGSGQPFTPSFQVSGRVTKVTTDMATGRPVATINIGSNNQVRENMKLMIARGDQFIANVVITKTDLQWSIGYIDYLSRSGVSVQEGDVVKSVASR